MKKEEKQEILDWIDTLSGVKGRKIFCSNCLRPEDMFTGGGSWSPDMCPCGHEDTIVQTRLSNRQLKKLEQWMGHERKIIFSN